MAERKERTMAESVYKVIDLVGTSNESWEKAAAAAIERASQTLRDLRVARVVEQDVHVEAGNALTYRVKLEVSFKYEGGASVVARREDESYRPGCRPAGSAVRR